MAVSHARARPSQSVDDRKFNVSLMLLPEDAPETTESAPTSPLMPSGHTAPTGPGGSAGAGGGADSVDGVAPEADASTPTTAGGATPSSGAGTPSSPGGSPSTPPRRRSMSASLDELEEDAPAAPPLKDTSHLPLLISINLFRMWSGVKLDMQAFLAAHRDSTLTDIDILTYSAR